MTLAETATALDVLTDVKAMSERLGVSVSSSEITRRKPGRRAMVRLVTSDGAMLAKHRVGHRPASAYKLMQRFRSAGFDSGDVLVAEPIAVFDDLNTWVQREIAGPPGDAALATDPCGVARLAAAAADRIHRSDVPARRVHTVDDELAILHARFDRLIEHRRDLAGGLSAVLAAAQLSADSVRNRPVAGAHRDYYHDQLIVTANGVAVIDFDLYCQADPALDLGNFVAHLHEHAVRVTDDSDAMASAMSAAIDHYCELAGESHRSAIAAWAHLSLARHISLSTEIPGRGHTTQTLIELCRSAPTIGP
jgi:hypothetical protein